MGSRAVFTIMFVVLGIGLSEIAVGSEGASISVTGKQGWMLTFNDEFNGSDLDPVKWLLRYRNRRGLEANYTLEDGVLHLRIEKDRPGIYKGKTRVSSIQTGIANPPPGISNFAQQYGWFEIRARCPQGSGLHSAFWMSPVIYEYRRMTQDKGTRKNENEPYEIDIFEQLGKTPYELHTTVHYGLDNEKNHRIEQKTNYLKADLTKGFHVYALEWNTDRLVWYVDGEEVFRSDKVPHNPFYLYLGLYEGAGWTGAVLPVMHYPKDFEIDYIRIYKRSDQ